jgi:uncharacterized protein
VTSRSKIPFHVIAKPIGPVCNLDCSYCFYLEKEKLYPLRSGKSKWAASEAVLRGYIRQYIEEQPSPVVNFVWQGGEPTLLGVEYFETVLKYQREYAGGKRVENALQTNGLLLDDRWCEFLAANGFLVGLSIDGPRELHDKYRVDRAGDPTFDKVVRGLEFIKNHGVEFNTLTSIQRDNSKHPLEVYRFLKDIGSRFIQFIPIVEIAAASGDPDGLTPIGPDSGADAEVSEWSVEPQQCGTFLYAIFDEWVRKDVGQVFVQTFDVALEAWAGAASTLCVFSPTCGDALVMEHNGDLYSCDHYVYARNRLGNLVETPLVEMVQSPRQRAFGRAKYEALPSYCGNCEYLRACYGGCPKHRFAKTPDGEPGLNYLCAAYRKFFAHAEPYMAFMAAELASQRPPANVMAWAREQDLSGSGRRAAVDTTVPANAAAASSISKTPGLIRGATRNGRERSGQIISPPDDGGSGPRRKPGTATN